MALEQSVGDNSCSADVNDIDYYLNDMKAKEILKSYYSNRHAISKEKRQRKEALIFILYFSFIIF